MKAIRECIFISPTSAGLPPLDIRLKIHKIRLNSDSFVAKNQTKGASDLGLAKQCWLSFLHFKRYQADLLIYWIKCDPLACVKR